MSGTMRKSNIELARIIAMVLIIAHHCVFHSNALSYVEGFNRDVAYFWLWGGKAGVNIFVLISSYFLWEKQHTFRQFVRVWCTSLFYYVAILLVSVFLLHVPVSRQEVVRNFLPILGYENWYVSTFCIWLLLVPLLNKIISYLSDTMIHSITASLFLLECLLPMFQETHYYTDLLFFIFLYFIMAEYHRGFLQFLNNKRICWAALLGSVAIIFMTEKITGSTAFAMNPSSIFCLAIGLSVFMLCLNSSAWYSKAVNMVGKATFGIFLLHTGNPIRRGYLWPQVFQCNRFFYSRWYWLWMLLCITALFVVGFVVDTLRAAYLEAPLQRTTFYQRFVSWGERLSSQLLGQ